MSTFRDILESDRDAILLNTDELAETISYTPAGGSAASVVAHVLRQEAGDDQFSDGRSLIERITVCVSSSSDNGIETVGPNDTVEVDSKTYTFEQLIETTKMGLHRIQFKRSSPIERAAGEVRNSR